MNHANLCATINKEKLIAILRQVPHEQVLPLVQALHLGGVRVIEFTFDHGHHDAIDSVVKKLQLVQAEYGNELLLGCGTVLSIEEAEAGLQNGAQLIISPHTDSALIAYTKVNGAVSIPGAFTPTEIVTAYKSGADYVKLFPAGGLGLPYLKALRGPLPHIPLLAVGGVDPLSIPAFLAAGITGFGVGGQLIEPKALSDKDYGTITQTALAFTKAIADWEDRT